MNDKTVHLVTGANGRTGLALCAELGSRGHFVRALVRKGSENYHPFLTPFVDEIVYGDIRDRESLDAAFAGADYVYHLAGIVSIASKMNREIAGTNIDGTKNVIDACLAHGVKRLVYTGTVHTLPFTDTKTVLREIPRFRPEEVHGSYAVSKAAASNLVLDAVKEQGLDAVIAMPSGIVGGFELKRSNFGQMLADVAEGRLPVYVKGRYDFVAVRDVARALADLALAGSAGESYIVSGNQVTVEELVTWAAKAAGVKPPKLCLPLPLVKLFSYPAERLALLRKRTLVFTPYAIKVLGDNCNFSHEKLTALTGYAPSSIEEAIREQVEYYVSVYKPAFMKKA
ncbi:MAG: NAD-dependent epimerase/dehydratase family protein [Spirochaetaceae bacterium]|jgi:dihydroflavonol-4-reductase|nr:NAD-dependent epimerase/dehydratase family protein [Spirochaetaceae bacterium]